MFCVNNKVLSELLILDSDGSAARLWVGISFSISAVGQTKKAKYNTTSKDQDSEDAANTSTQINSGAIESGNENSNNFSESSKFDEQDEHEILNTSFQAQASNSSSVSNNNEHISQNDKNNLLHDEHISNNSVTHGPDFGLAKQPQLVIADGESAIKLFGADQPTLESPDTQMGNKDTQKQIIVLPDDNSLPKCWNTKQRNEFCRKISYKKFSLNDILYG
ncbi:hypothetical protein RN001_008720 [Aquatica leii]|uniref:Uncharacterized protein n=1 Tax=Aquatica leii TaxID=1421715 RepID=A0AAN7SHD7_9COLE|nr:hypothetical protein RN001_008720 [Aquatica leii]